MEFLKNVLLKLFETGVEESLLPVVATVLQFSPAEVTRCKAARAARLAAGAPGEGAPGSSSYITSVAGWLL